MVRRELRECAVPESQRISDLLSAIGEESSYRAFFNEYAKLLAHRDEGEDVLIDSTPKFSFFQI
jgi:hypothetical protein